MENFITGYPGHEHEVRAALKRVLGQEKYEYFFDKVGVLLRGTVIWIRVVCAGKREPMSRHHRRLARAVLEAVADDSPLTRLGCDGL